MRSFRLFVSSPSDAHVERRRAERVVGRLNGEFAGAARLETIRWETEFYRGHETFQTQIPAAADCDIVLGILRWKLGTELPPSFAERLPDGSPYPSGTAYEILTSIDRRRGGADAHWKLAASLMSTGEVPRDPLPLYREALAILRRLDVAGRLNPSRKAAIADLEKRIDQLAQGGR